MHFLNDHIKPEIEIKHQEYTRAKLQNAVVGCQNRIGTTSYAVHLCDYISRRNGKAAYVCAYKDGDLQLEMMKEILEARDNGDSFELAGIDFYSSAFNVPDSYNAVVYDCGSVGKNAYSDVCERADRIYLIGGTSFSELPAVVSAQEPFSNINYTLIANFSSTADCDKYNELLSCNLNPVIAAPYAPKLFGTTAYDELFDKELESFSDKEHSIDENEEESAEAV